jgi:hypothetical protein
MVTENVNADPEKVMRIDAVLSFSITLMLLSPTEILHAHILKYKHANYFLLQKNSTITL